MLLAIAFLLMLVVTALVVLVHVVDHHLTELRREQAYLSGALTREVQKRRLAG